MSDKYKVLVERIRCESDPDIHGRALCELLEASARAIEELDSDASANAESHNDVLAEWAKCREQLAALQAQVAEAERQEPVAWMYRRSGSIRPDWRVAIDLPKHDAEMVEWYPLYARPVPAAVPDRDWLGRQVRDAWVRWAKTQPTPKLTWLVPYDELSESDKEADRQIGEHIASLCAAPSAPKPAAVPDGWSLSRCERNDGNRGVILVNGSVAIPYWIDADAKERHVARFLDALAAAQEGKKP